jgi:hypothetical protein
MVNKEVAISYIVNHPFAPLHKCSFSSTRIKLIDYGSSSFDIDIPHVSPAPCVQSRHYRAPEVLLGKPYDRLIDVVCTKAGLCGSARAIETNERAEALSPKLQRKMCKAYRSN